MIWDDRGLDLCNKFESDCFGSVDVTTDGVWCYIVLWVVPHYDSLILRWSHDLKTQLLSVCPSCPTYFLLNLMSPSPTPTSVYLLNFFCLDRTGLLHGTVSFWIDVSYECHLECVKICLQMLLKY